MVNNENRAKARKGYEMVSFNQYVKLVNSHMSIYAKSLGDTGAPGTFLTFQFLGADKKLRVRRAYREHIPAERVAEYLYDFQQNGLDD